MRRLGQFLLSNNAYTSVLVLVLVLIPYMHGLLTMLAAAVVGLVTLQGRTSSSALCVLWLAVPAVLSVWFHRFQGYEVVWLFCAVVWLFASLLRHFASWALVLECLLVVALCLLIGLHIAFPDLAAWWKQVWLHLADASTVISNMPTEEKQHLSVLFSKVATGLIAFYVMMFIVMVLLFARYWQAVVCEAVAGFHQEVLAIRLSHWVLLIPAVFLIGGVLKIPFFLDGIGIVLQPFVVASLSLLHALRALAPMGKRHKGLIFTIVLLCAYLGLLLLQYVVAPILACMGMIDTGLNLRKRIAASSA